MIVFSCPRCHEEMENPDSDAGHVVNCVECGQAVTLPDTGIPLPALPPGRRERSERPVRLYIGSPSFRLEWIYVAGFVVAALWLAMLYLTGKLGYN